MFSRMGGSLNKQRFQISGARCSPDASIVKPPPLHEIYFLFEVATPPAVSNFSVCSLVMDVTKTSRATRPLLLEYAKSRTVFNVVCTLN